MLFASDWSGTEDGQSVDCYVVELPVFNETTDLSEKDHEIEHKLYPNPLVKQSTLTFINLNQEEFTFELYNSKGELMKVINNITYDTVIIDKGNLCSGIYFYQLRSNNQLLNGKLIIE